MGGVQQHLETWLARCRDGHDDEWSVPAYVEREFRRYLECGILAHGFARARCGQCGHDFLIAFSCKGRGVCPSCNARRMVATAAHLTDHVLPELPLRQWVLAVPKRLRYFLERDADLQGAALRLFLRAVESCLRAHSPGSGPAARLGAVAFIHRFGSTLNAHLHFHCAVIDGVFEPGAGGVVFHAATGLDATAITKVQAQVRRRLLRGFVRRGLLPGDDAQAMAQWQHGGGFSLDASVRIAAADRAGRERLLRYCTRPPFALDRLRERDPEHLLYESAKPGPGGNGPQILTPLQLLDRLAVLVPPPRVHRHRYFGVLAPNSPLRAAVTALAPGATTAPPAPPPEPPTVEPAYRRAARYAWAMLLARIYEVFPLVCSRCGAEMRIIAFITDPSTIRNILLHVGEPTAPPHIAPARGPPLWDLPDARTDEFYPHAQPAPEVEFDQRITW
ncbi:MAG: IS91 family transposase [Chloroflexi bacterium CFX6]|nr:IS91 family transposase [Chloroflexi bacterium CFX6]